MKQFKQSIKPYFGLIFLSLLLLFAQAFADLSLPNYMSDIVNVGIQASGIEHAALPALSEDTYKFLVTVLPEKSASLFEASYTLNDAEGVYKRNQITQEVQTELDEHVGNAAWMVMELAKGQSPGTVQNSGSLTDLDAQQLFALTPVFDALPDAQKVVLLDKVNEVEPSVRTQTGVIIAQAFYKDMGKSLGTLQTQYIMIQGLKMIGLTLLAVLLAIAVSYISARVALGFGRRLRRAIFEKVEGLSMQEFNQFSTSSLIVRSTNDINQIQQLIQMGIRIFFYAPIMAIGGFVMIQGRDQSMSWIILAACAILAVVLVFVALIAVPKFKIMQKFVDRLNLVFKENISGLLVIRAFGNREFEAQRFDDANTDAANISRFVNRVMSFMMPIMMLIMNVTTIAIVWFGAHNINNGVIQIGDMMAFMQYAMQIIMSFLMISMMFIFLPRALVSMNRIKEVFDTTDTIQDPEVELPFDKASTGTVEFKNVSFKYGNAESPVLEDISFVAKPGEVTAIIGATGSGKSSLISLIPRFYDVTQGEVLVNGQDVREVKQHTLIDHIGYVPQKGMLLTGTVRDNLSYGLSHATDEDLLKALKIAQADFVLDSEAGLDMPITQGGTNVSGGQRQRLSIARALSKKSDIYIFDDSFSALDFKTDKKLRDALSANIKDAAMIIVAQRVNTIMDAAQIIVLDAGRIVGVGTHEALLRSCPTYYEIAASQLSKEELGYEATTN